MAPPEIQETSDSAQLHFSRRSGRLHHREPKAPEIIEERILRGVAQVPRSTTRSPSFLNDSTE